MRIASGKVVHGQIVYEGELPEGAKVTLLAEDNEETFEVTDELKTVLLESIAQCDRGETISADELLRELRNRELVMRFRLRSATWQRGTSDNWKYGGRLTVPKLQGLSAKNSNERSG